jgi:hypothetical protein
VLQVPPQVDAQTGAQRCRHIEDDEGFREHDVTASREAGAAVPAAPAVAAVAVVAAEVRPYDASLWSAEHAPPGP